jgi:hypothetical protein
MSFENAYEKCHKCYYLSEYCYDFPKCKKGFYYCEAWVEWQVWNLDIEEEDAIFSVHMPPEWWMKEFEEESQIEGTVLKCKCPDESKPYK